MANSKGKGKTKVKGESTTRVISQAGGVTLRARKIKNGETLYLDYMLNGERTTEFLEMYLVKEKTPLDKQNNKEILLQAEAIRAQRQIDLPSMKHNFIPQYKQKKNFFTVFDQEKAKRPKNTQHGWGSIRKKIVQFNGGKEILPFNRITSKWLEEFKEFLAEEFSKENTAASYYQVTLTVIKTAKRDGIIKDDPSENVKTLQGVETLREFHTPDEVNTLFHHPCKDDRVRRAYLHGCLTGLRSCDLFSMKRNRYETATLPDGSIEYRLKLVQQKVTDPLYLSISKEAYDLAVEGVEDPEARVFPLYSDNDLRIKLRKWVQSAGIKKHVGWHTARHTNAVIMLMNGVDIYTISKRLGHKDITTTMRYLHIVDTQMQKAANISVIKPPSLSVAA